MIKTIKMSSLLVFALLLNSCASGYKKINPRTLSYNSKNTENNVTLEYKYELLHRKYKKNETKNGIKLIAIKITNNTEKDLSFGQDFRLTYENNNALSLIATDRLFKDLKQSPASYLWYLLLAPVRFYSGTTTTQNGNTTETKSANSFPIGFILAPGIAGGNMLVAGSANKNLKNELMEFDLLNKKIKKGETVYGLIGVSANNYDAIKIRMN
jgi:hypothetical protein